MSRRSTAYFLWDAAEGPPQIVRLPSLPRLRSMPHSASPFIDIGGKSNGRWCHKCSFRFAGGKLTFLCFIPTSPSPI